MPTIIGQHLCLTPKNVCAIIANMCVAAVADVFVQTQMQRRGFVPSSLLSRLMQPFCICEQPKWCGKSLAKSYEIENDKGRKEYKIFPSELELNHYLHNNKHKRCTSAQPLFVSPRYTACTSQQLRMLTKGEIEKYLKERNSQYK